LLNNYGREEEMNRKAVFGTVLAMLLVSMVIAAFNIQPIASQPAPLGFDVKIEPEHPTVRDQVIVTVIIPDVPSISYGINFSPLIRVDNEFSVDINVSVPWIVLFAYLGNVSHTYELGNLSEGSYNFSATVHYWYQLPNETWPSWPSDYSYSKSFAVSSLSSPGLCIEPTWNHVKDQAVVVNVSIFAAYNLTQIESDLSIEFKIKYDTTFLELTNVTEGNFVNSLGYSTLFTSYVNDSWLHVGILLIPPYVIPPVIPPTEGTLATVRFRAHGQPTESIWTFLDLRCETAVCVGGWICLVEDQKTDLNGDGIVNILDLAVFATSFGSHLGHERWNASADINEDGLINIVDGAIIARQLGKTFEPPPPIPMPH
jgi:hypothetical protein